MDRIATCFEGVEMSMLNQGAAFLACHDATTNVSATADPAISEHATTSNATILTGNAVSKWIQRSERIFSGGY